MPFQDRGVELQQRTKSVMNAAGFGPDWRFAVSTQVLCNLLDSFNKNCGSSVYCHRDKEQCFNKTDQRLWPLLALQILLLYHQYEWIHCAKSVISLLTVNINNYVVHSALLFVFNTVSLPLLFIY